MTNDVRVMKKKEFVMFGVGALGQGMVYAIMSSYISDFYINILRVSPLFVLFLMLGARLWDAVNDPMMGMIADRTRTKYGSMRPYLLITPIPIAVLTLLLFIAPNLSETGRMVYASITYILWGMIYTMGDVPFWSLPNTVTPNAKERGSYISFGRTLNGIGSAVPMAMFMALGFILPLLGLSGLELEKAKYISIAVVASVIGMTMFAMVFFNSKERVVLPRKKREAGEPSSLKLIITCKPLMLVVLMGILAMGRYLLQVGAVHVARYSFYIGPSLVGLSAAEQEAAIQSSISLVSTIFSVSTAIGMFGTMLIMPLLFKKFNYKQIVIASCLTGFVSSMIMYFIGYGNLWVLVPFLIISSIPLGVLNIVSYAMIGDALDYMEWKTGRRENALGSSCQSFVNKLSNAFATSFIVLIYIVADLDLSTIGVKFTPNPTAMDVSIRQGLFASVSLVPAICMLLCVIPIFFYDLVGEKKEKILAELALRREQNNEGETSKDNATESTEETA